MSERRPSKTYLEWSPRGDQMPERPWSLDIVNPDGSRYVLCFTQERVEVRNAGEAPATLPQVENELFVQARDLLCKIAGETDAARMEVNAWEAMELSRKMRAAVEPATVRPEDLAAALAHRACCGVEHDPAQGKLHGCCVVCGVPWPCDTAKHFLRPPPTEPAK